MRRSGGLIVIGAGLALLTGCTAAGSAPTATATVAAPAASAPASSEPASTAPASSAPAPGASGTPSSSASRVSSGGRTDPDAPDGQCADDALRVAVREQGGGLGSRQDEIVFTNTGSGACTLQGAPGVSVVGRGDGTQLGKPAGRSPGTASAVRLAPGGTATAELSRIFVDQDTTTFNGQDGQIACRPEHGDGYRIYPPHSFRAVLVRHDVWACTSGFVWMHVAPVVAG